MDAEKVKRCVIYCAIFVMVLLIGTAVAANQCSDNKVLDLETVLVDLNCSEQDKTVIKKVFSAEISECDRAMIIGVCKPDTAEQGLTEENSLRLELNNTTIKESSK